MTETPPDERSDTATIRFVIGVVVKAVLLFVAFNLAYAVLDPLPALSRLSVYNTLVPGRVRLPFGENPDIAYNFSLFQLDAMFASHVVTQPKPADEYRVILIGDSSVWGFLLTPPQTLAGQINAADLTLADGRHIRAYNLGYPTITLTKDLLMLSRAVDYQPDLIVWLTTLEAFPYSQQLTSPIIQHNSDPVCALIGNYSLSLNPRDPAFVDPAFVDRTIVGQRRALADVLRLNLYGFMWAATGVDQFYPDTYTPAQTDLEADPSFFDLQPPLARSDLAFDVLGAGVALAGQTPVLLVNEPILISSGQNSDVRYNFFYPHWAYDDYRALLANEVNRRGWRYLDLWDLVPPEQFTNSAIHLTPIGSSLLADRLGAAIVDQAGHAEGR